MADALASGASVLRDVGVQVPPRTLQVFDDSARFLLTKLACADCRGLDLGFRVARTTWQWVVVRGCLRYSVEEADEPGVVGLFTCVWARSVAAMVRWVSYLVLALRRFFVCPPGVVGGEPRLGR